jgi:calcium/calmodulin-dependent protein kinase I
MVSNGGSGAHTPQTQAQAQVQPCRYKTGKTLGAGSYSVVKECVHIDTGRYYAAKVINKRLMAGREHMVSIWGTCCILELMPVRSAMKSPS